jgi:hypothetical protein
MSADNPIFYFFLRNRFLKANFNNYLLDKKSKTCFTGFFSSAKNSRFITSAVFLHENKK